MFYRYLLSVFILVFFTACTSKDKKEYTNIQVDWSKIQNYYLQNLEEALKLHDSINVVKTDSKENKEFFKQIRFAYKKAEAYCAYLNPEATSKLNGPSLPVFRENSGKVLTPIGLQRLEEIIYLKDGESKELIRLIDINKGFINKLKNDVNYYKLNPQRFFISITQQLLSLITLSISGFDTPVSQLGVIETSESLKSLEYVYKNSIQYLVKKQNTTLDKKFIKSIDKAINYIDKNKDFLSFNRFVFIRNYINPITKNWVAVRKETNLYKVKNLSDIALNIDAVTFFEKNTFNLNYFLSFKNQDIIEEQILLGKKLFFEPKLSKVGTMSCASCHKPEKGYADGLKVAITNSNTFQKRNTPTVLNTIYQKSFFLDGRSKSLEDQIGSVFQNKEEFNTELHQFSSKVLKDSVYIKLFKKAYKNKLVNNENAVLAISAYVTSLSSFNTKFDKNMRGEETTFTPEEINGFNLYMGKAQCATCHFVPLTNGSLPPFFNKTEREIIGVPKTENNKEIDTDLGYFNITKQEVHKNKFKTPTLRNINLTAPYMHNGVYESLEEVINFYNMGGGVGFDFNVVNQTLPSSKLNLTNKEIKSLVTFMSTLNNSYE